MFLADCRDLLKKREKKKTEGVNIYMLMMNKSCFPINICCVFRLSSLSHFGTVGRPGLESWGPEVGKPGCSNKSEEGGCSPVQVQKTHQDIVTAKCAAQRVRQK